MSECIWSKLAHTFTVRIKSMSEGVVSPSLLPPCIISAGWIKSPPDSHSKALWACWTRTPDLIYPWDPSLSVFTLFCKDNHLYSLLFFSGQVLKLMLDSKEGFSPLFFVCFFFSFSFDFQSSDSAHVSQPTITCSHGSWLVCRESETLATDHLYHNKILMTASVMPLCWHRVWECSIAPPDML